MTDRPSETAGPNGDPLWRLCRRILRLDPATRRDGLSRKTAPSWDSLAHVNLLLAIDARFGTNLAAEAHAVETYADIAARLAARGPEHRAESDDNAVTVGFLGNCHAFLTYRHASSWLKRAGAGRRFALHYHDVDHLLRWGESRRGERGDALAAAFARDCDRLLAPFERYLAEARVWCVAQIFQLSAELNLLLLRALRQRFPRMKRLVFQPMPHLPEFRDTPPGSEYWTPRRFEPNDFMTPQKLSRLMPELECLDASAALVEFHRVNRGWSFRLRQADAGAAKPPAGLALDPTHCHDPFWRYFFDCCAAPVLFGATPTPASAVPDFRGALQPLAARAASGPDRPEELLDRLSAAPAPHFMLDEAGKRIWRDKPQWRGRLLAACLDRDRFANLWGLIAQDDWLGCEEATLSEEAAMALDRALTQATDGFRDERRVREAAAVLCAVYFHATRHPAAELATARWMDRHLFAHDWLFDAWQRFLTRWRQRFDRFPVLCSPAALTRLRTRVTAAVAGRSWLLYGAGALTAYLLTALEPEERPLALVSGLPEEQGAGAAGLTALSPEQAAKADAELIVLALRAAHLRVVAPRLRTLTPRVKALPLAHLAAPAGAAPAGDTLTGRFHRAFERNRFALTWRDAAGATRRYSMQDLAFWGEAILDGLPVELAPGDPLPIALPTSPAVYALFYAATLRGLAPALLSYPTDRRNPADYRVQIEATLANLKAKTLIADPRLAALTGGRTAIHELADPYTPTFAMNRRDIAPAPAQPEQYAFIQHSSGTTGLQKATPITHGQALVQVEAYGAALGVGSDDSVASWLPLYHDMGLLTALIGPAVWEIPVVACDPTVWVARPVTILEMISEHRATLCWQPNFAFAFLAQTVADEALRDLDLSCLRAAVNCAEPITAAAEDAFLDRFQACGLRSSAPAACYAMAETVFAIAQSPPDQRASRVAVDEAALKRGLIHERPGSGRVLLSSGELLPICQVRVVGEDGAPLPEHAVGRIRVQSQSLFDGYLRGSDLDRASLDDGWHDTGDLGFLRRNRANRLELFVTGRAKDLIIIAGENFYPQDIETAAEAVDGVKPGRSVAFGLFDPVRQTESLVIAVERAATTERTPDRVIADIQAAVMARFELHAARVLVFPPRTMIKSSAGKISRSASQAMIREKLRAEATLPP